MIEDKLTHEERIRLESISQAANFIAITGGKSQTDSSWRTLLNLASKISKYIRTGEE